MNTLHQETSSADPTTHQQTKLVNAHSLLEILFEKQSRPSLRWLRQMQAQRKIPYVKIGHLVRFDVEKVRVALEENCTVQSRTKLK